MLSTPKLYKSQNNSRDLLQALWVCRKATLQLKIKHKSPAMYEGAHMKREICIQSNKI